MSNPTINPQKIFFYDVDESQCMVAQVYLELIAQSTSLSHFVQLLYSSQNADKLTLVNMATQIRDLDGLVKPIFQTKALHDFYYHKMLPRISRSRYHEYPTELWPCWYSSADRKLVYPNGGARGESSDTLTSMYLRGDPFNTKKGNTLYYRQAGWLLNEDSFMETKNKLQLAEVRISTGNLQKVRKLYEKFDLGESDNLVFFVSNADQGTHWTDGRDALKAELEKVKKPTQRLLYISAGYHDVLMNRKEG